MQKVRLSGRYKYNKASPCDFEDIHLFLRMSNSVKIPCDNVEVAVVDIGTILFAPAPVQSWRIVERRGSNKLVMAVRISSYHEKYPVVYEVDFHKKSGVPVLIRKNVLKLEALQLFYDYSTN